MYIAFNRELKECLYDPIESIKRFIKKITYEYGVKLQYHDMADIFRNDYQLGQILMEYYSHDNDFCRYVKSNGKCAYECFKKKNTIGSCAAKAVHPFYGECHMGMEEMIFPLFTSGNIIGYFTVGEFCTDKERARLKLHTKAMEWGFNEAELRCKFFKNTQAMNVDIKKLAADMNILIQYINMYISNSISATDIRNKAENSASANSKTYIADTAREYILENYSSDISLEKIAKLCHCNSSYLSHIFKKKQGCSISEFITACRINRAKYLLLSSDCSVTETAFLVGYNDSGYFARVFKKTVGQSPEKFRQKQ